MNIIGGRVSNTYWCWCDSFWRWKVSSVDLHLWIWPHFKSDTCNTVSSWSVSKVQFYKVIP